MIGFEQWAEIRHLHDGTDDFVLTNNLVYHSNGGSVYTVDAGFVTDLASIPRFLWSLYPPHGLYLSAAILHDKFCKASWISRKEGDILFREAMSHSHVGAFDRFIIYQGVRLGASWNKWIKSDPPEMEKPPEIM